MIDGVLDHETGVFSAREAVNPYTTSEPTSAFHRRIEFCLDCYSEAVKAMRYPPPPPREDLETAEQRREAQKELDALHHELEEEGDDDMDF